MTAPCPGFIIAAPASGSGKTTVTLGLLAALRRRGLRVAAAKVGPDYIDPAFHAAAARGDSVNLDSWAMGGPLLDQLAADAAAGADVLVCEGVMGLFDGANGPGRCGDGSTADIAARTGWPVILVINVAGQAQSAAALARGFASHRAGVRVAGVIANNVGGAKHGAMVAAALAPLGLPLLGALPRNAAVTLPERHLGLVQAGEIDRLSARLDALGDWTAQHIDLDAVLRLAAPSQAAPPPPSAGARRPALAPLGQRIAVARDAAFTFVYPHLLTGWRAAGADIIFFAPLADEAPPDDADAVFLPGGYPELHGPALAAAANWRAGMIRFAATRPVYGECGGYMALGETLEAADGTSHPMLGLLGHRTSFATRRLHLGYRRAVLQGDSAVGPAGAVVFGHEFHYATVVSRGDDPPLFTATDAAGDAVAAMGGRRGRVAGSFLHIVAAGD